MPSCDMCHQSTSSIHCLRCEKYYCLLCSRIDHHRHLLGGLEERLTTQINSLQTRFNEKFYRQYLQAVNDLNSWIADVRRQFEYSIQYQLEQSLRKHYDQLKTQTDDYVQECVQYFVNLRDNVRYVKQQQQNYDCDHDIHRLVNIEKELINRYDGHHLDFHLDTHSIDFSKYINVEKQFQEAPVMPSLDFNYRLYQPLQTLHLQSSIQHIASSCLDLFVFTRELHAIYPRLLEFSTLSASSTPNLEHSIDFPLDVQIIDMRWSIQFNCLFLLTSSSLHKYDKYDRKIHANILKPSDDSNKWHRFTTNRFGLYIQNENNYIEFYNTKLSEHASFNMNDRLENLCLVYDLQGQGSHLCLLTYTKEYIWEINLLSSRRLELQRTLKLPETLRSPLKLLNVHRRNIWILVNNENHRLIVFDSRMKNIEHISLTSTPNCATILDDETLVIVSPDLEGAKISFYSRTTILKT